ncbi:hypothetical protein LCGC14_0714510 [marine sediment metagenome]|uniref:Uncharacterized protein n=1 Tax=marine sediment metagenome TaxID=412755 RepID=A0A0F9QZI8_9ZZZZ
MRRTLTTIYMDGGTVIVTADMLTDVTIVEFAPDKPCRLVVKNPDGTEFVCESNPASEEAEVAGA